MTENLKIISSAVAALLLAVCGACSLTTVSTDTASSLDAGVQALTQIDKGIALYADLPACSGAQQIGCEVPATVARLKADAETARTGLEAAQAATATATQAASALALLATITAEFSALPTSTGATP
jgi:uncharacterized phage infection (PIP) family protein YhgE